MTCKGICKRYKAKMPVNLTRYADGQKRCSTCVIFIRWDGLRCPCCGMFLRLKPRVGKFKEILREKLKV